MKFDCFRRQIEDHDSLETFAPQPPQQSLASAGLQFALHAPHARATDSTAVKLAEAYMRQLNGQQPATVVAPRQNYPLLLAFIKVAESKLGIPNAAELQIWHSMSMGKPNDINKDVLASETVMQFYQRCLHTHTELSQHSEIGLATLGDSAEHSLLNTFCKGLPESYKGKAYRIASELSSELIPLHRAGILARTLQDLDNFNKSTLSGVLRRTSEKPSDKPAPRDRSLERKPAAAAPSKPPRVASSKPGWLPKAEYLAQLAQKAPTAVAAATAPVAPTPPLSTAPPADLTMHPRGAYRNSRPEGSSHPGPPPRAESATHRGPHSNSSNQKPPLSCYFCHGNHPAHSCPQKDKAMALLQKGGIQSSSGHAQAHATFTASSAGGGAGGMYDFAHMPPQAPPSKAGMVQHNPHHAHATVAQWSEDPGGLMTKGGHSSSQDRHCRAMLTSIGSKALFKLADEISSEPSRPHQPHAAIPPQGIDQRIILAVKRILPCCFGPSAKNEGTPRDLLGLTPSLQPSMPNLAWSSSSCTAALSSKDAEVVKTSLRPAWLIDYRPNEQLTADRHLTVQEMRAIDRGHMLIDAEQENPIALQQRLKLMQAQLGDARAETANAQAAFAMAEETLRRSILCYKPVYDIRNQRSSSSSRPPAAGKPFEDVCHRLHGQHAPQHHGRRNLLGQAEDSQHKVTNLVDLLHRSRRDCI